MSRENKILASFLLIILCALSWAFFFQLKPLNSFFVTTRLAYIESSLASSAHLPQLLDSGVPGVITLTAILHQVTGIPLEQFQYWPLAAIILAVGSFTLCQYFVKSTVLTFLLVGSIAWDLGFGPDFYSVGIKGYGNVLYLFFLLVMLKYVRTRNVSLFIALFTIFVAAHFVDYTAEFWMVATTTLFMVAVLIGWKVFHVIEAASLFNPFLPMIFIVLFLGFQKLIYQDAILVLATNSVSASAVTTALSKLIPWLPAQPLADYEYIQPIPGEIVLISWLRYLLLLIPVAIAVISTPIKAVKLRRDRVAKEFLASSFLPYVLFFMVGTAIVEIVTYIPFGSVRLVFVASLFPILATALLFNLDLFIVRAAAFKTGILLVFLVLLFGLNVCSSWLSQQNRVFPQVSQTDAAPSADWLLTHSPGNVGILSDIDTIGKYQMEAANIGKPLRWYVFDSELYRRLINGSLYGFPGNFVVGDMQSDRGTPGWWWKFYEPLSRHEGKLGNNASLLRIYDDSQIVIYQVVRPTSP